MKRHNILFLMGVYPGYGGVEKVSTILANSFKKQGHHVCIVSFKQPCPELAEKELSEGIKLYKLKYPVNCRQNATKLHELLMQEKIDIIINQWYVPWYVAHLCKRAMQGTTCHLISVHHNLPNTNARIKAVEIDLVHGNGNKWVNHFKLKLIQLFSRLSMLYTSYCSDRIVVLSPSYIKTINNFVFGYGLRKTTSIGNPITIDKLTSFDSKLKNKEIIYVGRIEYNQKRTFRLVDIWNELENRFPDWQLTIVGDGPDADDLRTRIISAKLKHISITGFCNPLPYYRRASILVLVSEYEGFGLVLVEAMANGCVPVVLGSYSAATDIVKPSCGVVLPMPYDKDKLVKALSQLMRQSDMRKNMAVQGMQEAERYSLECIVKQWNSLFDSLYAMKLNEYTEDKPHRLKQLAWRLVNATLFRMFPGTPLRVLRNLLLRAFGADIPLESLVYPSCRIWAPWNLKVGRNSCIGSGVRLYNKDKITIGDNVVISQNAFLCTASHDISSPRHALITAPIVIRDLAWVASDAYIGMGVTIGEGAVVGATASVYKDIEPWTVVGGNPAKFLKQRILINLNGGVI